jgi:hypothetical protein
VAYGASGVSFGDKDVYHYPMRALADRLNPDGSHAGMERQEILS